MHCRESEAFVRWIVRGGADKSYGIQVARLAGVPLQITNRAKEIVERLTNADIVDAASVIQQKAPAFQDKDGQFVLTTADDIVHRKLKDIEPDKLTPLEAINILYELKALL